MAGPGNVRRVSELCTGGSCYFKGLTESAEVEQVAVALHGTCCFKDSFWPGPSAKQNGSTSYAIGGRQVNQKQNISPSTRFSKRRVMLQVPAFLASDRKK